MRPRAIAYLLSAYPDFHETFVAREVEGMRQQGIDLRIYSLKPPPEGAYLYRTTPGWCATCPSCSTAG
ncbi:MAG: hypothetical protein IPG57_11470 [Burkholderiales bacterium]|nr:hypothetical protein [Burkholderiales bacterium]